MTETRDGTFVPKTVDVKVVHGDLSQEVVSITLDRLRLILHKHGGDLGRNRDWVAPAGVLLSLLLTFVTTDFKEKWLPSDTWKAIFVLLTVASIAWLGKTLLNLWRAESVEDLVEKIKRQT